jgi:hypothetical protein
MRAPKPREGTPDPKLAREAFLARFRSQFPRGSFDGLGAELDRVAEAAWAEYDDGHKAPQTRKTGDPDYDPDYDLAVDWIAARAAIDAVEILHGDPSGPRASS